MTPVDVPFDKEAYKKRITTRINEAMYAVIERWDVEGIYGADPHEPEASCRRLIRAEIARIHTRAAEYVEHDESAPLDWRTRFADILRSLRPDPPRPAA